MKNSRKKKKRFQFCRKNVSASQFASQNVRNTMSVKGHAVAAHDRGIVSGEKAMDEIEKMTRRMPTKIPRSRDNPNGGYDEC